MHFYMRNAKKEDIDKFKKDNKLKYLGMPVFLGSGSQEIDGMKHRFLVMPRYGQNIWDIFLKQNRKFPLHTVYRLGCQLINVLEYIHTQTYVHMDLKGANILLGFGKGGDENVHLLDYGLACHYNTKEYKTDPKKAHNGTIEYLSRDSHNGVATMRGDIEILAYNLIEWAGAKLPWTASQSILSKPVEVQKMKESFMNDIEKSLKSAFDSGSVPSPLSLLFKYVAGMKHDTSPDYGKIRGIFESGLKELKASNSGKLDFADKNIPKSPVKRAQAAPKNPSPAKKPRKAGESSKKVVEAKKKKSDTADESDTEEEPVQSKSKRTRGKPRYVEESDEESEDERPKSKSSKKENSDKNEKSPKKAKTSAAAKGQVVLKSKTGSSKKVVELNFDLNISCDSDLIVTVNRKDKNNKKTEGSDDAKKSDGEEKDRNHAGYYKGKFAKS